MMENNDKATYLSEIVAALEALDGMGSLKEIDEVIERRNFLAPIHSNPNWKDNVSAELQRHCSQTRSYRGQEDLFYSVYGLGAGYWGLKRDKNQNAGLPINPIERRQEERIRADDGLTATEKEAVIKARVGQGEFRKKLLKKYGSCLITGISDERLLIASHIKPWRDADNRERVSDNNGLLLSPLYDKLFDIGLMTFASSGKVIVSAQLSAKDRAAIPLDAAKIYLSDMNAELKTNMEYHRDVVFLG